MYAVGIVSHVYLIVVSQGFHLLFPNRYSVHKGHNLRRVAWEGSRVELRYSLQQGPTPHSVEFVQSLQKPRKFRQVSRRRQVSETGQSQVGFQKPGRFAETGQVKAGFQNR